MSDTEQDAFIEQETETRSRGPKSIKLPLKEDGSIDWDNTSEKHTTAFIGAIKADPNGILQNIREEAGTSSPDDAPEGIADATVVAGVNALMVCEALVITGIGPRFAPVLKNLHPVVAIKACAVSAEELEPVMPACKRIIQRYVPLEYLGQEYQDIAILAQHLLKLSTEKFKACIDLAMSIEQMQNGKAPHKPNGRVIIDATPQGRTEP